MSNGVHTPYEPIPCAAHRDYHTWQLECYRAWLAWLDEYCDLRPTPEHPYLAPTEALWRKWHLHVEQLMAKEMVNG